MKLLFLKKSLTALLYVFLAFSIEAFTFLMLGWGFFPQYILFDIAMILFFGGLIFSCKRSRLSNAMISILVVIQIILSYTNICIYKTLNDTFTFNMFSLIGETLNVITFDMFPKLPLLFFLGVIVAMVASMFALNKIRISPSLMNSENKLTHKFISMIILTATFCIYSVQGVILNTLDDQWKYLDDSSLYTTFSSSKLALKKFGSFGFYFEEFFRFLYNPINSSNQITRAQVEDYLKKESYDPTKTELFNICKDSNVITMLLESFEWYVINEELTPTLYALSRGYDFKSGGEFYNIQSTDGKTVFVRNANSISGSNLDKNGLALVNYYSKAKTDYSETSVLLGNYPYGQSFTTRGGIFSFSSTGLYSDINYNFTLPNLLKDSSAVSTSKYFHSYLSTFYGRTQLMPQFGFDSTLFLDGMNGVPVTQDGSTIVLSKATLDSAVLERYITDICPIKYNASGELERFYSHYTTVTTHGDFETKNELLSEEMYKKVLAYFGYSNMPATGSDEFQNIQYFTKALDTEYMMSYLMHYLLTPHGTNGTILYDDTLLVLFSDHQSYYGQMDLREKSKYYSGQSKFANYFIDNFRDKEDVSNFSHSPQRYNVPALIYSPKINSSTIKNYNHNITKMTQAFDLTPTILTLLGIDFNPNKYIGYPVMCKVVDTSTGNVNELGTKIFVSHTGGFFNMEVFSDDGLIALYNKNNLSQDIIKNGFSIDINAQIKKWKYITMIYEYNLF
ncbi:MAG: hypothetical protein RR334_00280 [Clostridia bacterium]